MKLPAKPVVHGRAPNSVAMTGTLRVTGRTVWFQQATVLQLSQL
jgi:hypothetical protein